MSVAVVQFEIVDLTVDEVIDLTVDEVIDLSQDEEGQEIIYYYHHHLNGYISDNGFVVAPGEGESEAEEDDESEMEEEEEEEEEDDESEINQVQVHSECSICLENVTEDDEGGNVTILPCGHTFHDVCMTGWLLAKPEGECPTCKGTIVGAQNI